MSDIDDIKSRIDIVDLISKRITLKKAGRNFKALCPFHGEKSPSFVVSPDRQTFHCFGCGKGGTIFDFVMLLDHVDFAEALESLAEQAGVKLQHRVSDSPEAKTKQKILEVNKLTSEYFHYLLTKHAVGDAARRYLAGRGISDKSIATFTLGYSANDWDGLYKFLRKKGYDDKLLETAGLIIRGGRGFYDRFRGRVMFTLKDHRGNVVGFAGRVMDPTAKEAKYINTSETPVYVKSKVLYGLDVTKDAIQKANQAVLMEGEIDVISSFQAGIGNVVAIKGSAVTEEHAHLLHRFTDRLVFALDSDLAGDAAARRGIDIAERAGFDMKVARMPSGKDPDEAAREHPGLLKKAIEDAEPIYDYFIASAAKRYDIRSSYGKKQISEELLPIFAKMENSVVQGHYARTLAKLLDVAEETVLDGIAKSRRRQTNMRVPSSPAKSADPAAEQTVLSRLEKTELYLLTLLLQGKTAYLLPKLLAVVSPEQIRHVPVRRIVETLSGYMKDHTEFDVKAFGDVLPAELGTTFDEAYLSDISSFIEDEVRFDHEWEKSLMDLRKLRLKSDIEKVSHEMRDSGAADDKQSGEYEAKLAALSAELRTLEKTQ
jgi:DNA primase